MGALGSTDAGPSPVNARELQAVIHAERDGAPFFVYRGPGGEQQIVRFDLERGEFTVGRNPTADLSLAWDTEVSALHAIVELLAGELTLIDDGLSRNGSYVNGERVRGMRRLRDHDMLRIGSTIVLVRIPSDAARRSTSAASKAVIVPVLSDQQRRVLYVLSRPLRDASASAAPATNQEIADQLHLSVAAVKLHLRALFEKFGIAHLPQNAKRLVLAQQALRTGLLTDDDGR